MGRTSGRTRAAMQRLEHQQLTSKDRALEYIQGPGRKDPRVVADIQSAFSDDHALNEALSLRRLTQATES